MHVTVAGAFSGLLILAASFACAAEAKAPVTRGEAIEAIQALGPTDLPQIEIFFEGDLLEQMASGFSGPQFDTDTADGFVAVTGCRQHSCPEKTTLFYRDDDLAGVVLTHARCTLFGGSRGCASRQVFTLFGPDMETLNAILSALPDREDAAIVMIRLPEFAKAKP